MSEVKKKKDPETGLVYSVTAYTFVRNATSYKMFILHSSSSAIRSGYGMTLFKLRFVIRWFSGVKRSRTLVVVLCRSFFSTVGLFWVYLLILLVLVGVWVSLSFGRDEPPPLGD